MKTDIEPEGIPAEAPSAAIKIETIEDYEKATARAFELAGQANEGAEERELDALLSAIGNWAKEVRDDLMARREARG